MMRAIAALMLASSLVACSVQQPEVTPRVTDLSPHALPIKGRLAEGDPNELPPAVAMSLASDSNITFTYREELSHDEHHIPRWFSWMDPVTYAGAPVGDYGATAFASLTISQGDRTLGDYTAKAYVTKSYSLYAEPTHKELDDAAIKEVRARIDQKLYSDESRLSQAAAAPAR